MSSWTVSKKGAGRGMRDKAVKIVCYVDDAVIISKNEDNLQRLLHKLQLIAEKYNMSTSIQKT